jgi:signal transduction histidine kinase
LEAIQTRQEAFIKPEGREESTIFEPKNVRDLAQQVFRTVQSVNPGGEIALEGISDEEILVPTTQLRAALTALLENALEATKNVAAPCVRLSLSFDGDARSEDQKDTSLQGTARLAVEDNGSGISEEMHQEMFEPFKTTKALGSGLGLYASRKLMRSVGGDVRYIVTQDPGSLFEVVFPYRKG